MQRHLPNRTVKKKNINSKQGNIIIRYIIYQANALISQKEDLHTSYSCHHRQIRPTANNQQGVIISK